MKLSILVFGLFFWNQKLFSQFDSPHRIDVAYCDETPAIYPGGKKSMTKLFSDNLKYPESLDKKGIGGKVIVLYEVDTFGNTRNAKIVQSVCKELDDEAVRLIYLLKKWKPATLHGKKIKYYNRQPFTFLPDTQHKRSRKVKNTSTRS